MPIFYEEQKFLSEKNGELIYRKYWNGKWSVKVPEGEYYSGNYLESMWFFALGSHKAPNPSSRLASNGINILILGSGAGCAVYASLKLWPQAQITALDYDPIILDIGKKHYGDFAGRYIQFVTGNAESYIELCKKQYDLVVVDLFLGNRPAPILKNEKFLRKLRKTATDNGVIIANLSTQFGGDDEHVFNSWYKTFPESMPVRYKGNKLAVAKVNNIPDDYYNIFQSKDYAESLKTRGLIVIGQPKSYLFIQPLAFGLGVVTAMHTDFGPSVEEIKRASRLKHGLIIWSTWKRTFVNKPWRRNLLPPLHQKGNGFSVVDENYKKKWSETARRDLKKAINSPARVYDVTKEEFIDALNKSILSKSLKNIFSQMLERLSGATIEFWAAKDGGKPLGGLAVMNYGNISAHLVAFMTENGRSSHVGTLLIDYWNKYALKNNIKYLNFGHIRQQGEPRAWQGYSDFKRKFIEREITIPNQYFRLF